MPRKRLIEDLTEVAGGSDSDDRSGTWTESPSSFHRAFFTEDSVDNRGSRGPEPCTESELNYNVSALLEVDVLAEVRKSCKIAVTTNESIKGDVSARKVREKGGTTADSNKVDVATDTKDSGKGDTTAD